MIKKSKPLLNYPFKHRYRYNIVILQVFPPNFISIAFELIQIAFKFERFLSSLRQHGSFSIFKLLIQFYVIPFKLYLIQFREIFIQFKNAHMSFKFESARQTFNFVPNTNFDLIYMPTTSHFERLNSINVNNAIFLFFQFLFLIIYIIFFIFSVSHSKFISIIL